MAVPSKKCGSCGEVTEKAFHVDHDHSCCSGERTCGKCTRGILCGKCNRAIGWLDDDHDKVRAAMAYLRGENPWP